MSKKKKVTAKAGKKAPVKKVSPPGGKKTSKPSPTKNAAKTPSKSTKTSKAKPVVKKTTVKSAVKTAKSSSAAAKNSGKKSKIKASQPKSAAKSPAKNGSKSNTPKKVIVKKAAPAKKVAVKKTVSKKTVAKAPVKTSKPIHKPVKAPVSKQSPAAGSMKGNPVVKAAAPVAVKKESPAQAEKARKAEEADIKRQVAERKATEVLAITNTIPVKEKNEISLSKIASISHSITNPIKKTDSYAIKPEKEPPGKFEMEFVVHSSAEMLYEFLSTPSGLSEWFCDDLNIRNGIYTFIWEDQLQQARLLKTVEFQLVRFQWVDKTDGSYFEFKIQRDDLTNDISLIITDFADSPGDRESSKLLWHSQIEKLMHVIGSIF